MADEAAERDQARPSAGAARAGRRGTLGGVVCTKHWSADLLAVNVCCFQHQDRLKQLRAEQRQAVTVLPHSWTEGIRAVYPSMCCCNLCAPNH